MLANNEKNKIAHRNDVANHLKRNVTLETYFSSWTMTKKAIELNWIAEGQRNAV